MAEKGYLGYVTNRTINEIWTREIDPGPIIVIGGLDFIRKSEKLTEGIMICFYNQGGFALGSIRKLSQDIC